MRIMHFADLHLDESTAPNSEQALHEILTAARALEPAPDLIVNAGDLAMRRGHLSPWASERLRAFHCDLSSIAPVIVLEGNHDLTYQAGKPGMISGILSHAAGEGERLVLAEQPCILKFPGLPEIACLPYPSKFRLLAQTEGVDHFSVNERVQFALVSIVQGLGAQVKAGALLLFHGTIEGAKAGTETIMSTEIDALLRENDIPACFAGVLCGHIHRRQVIGRAVYPGSPAPLSFSEESYEHGFALWDSLEDGRWVTTFHDLDPAERLLTVDVRGAADPVEEIARKDPRALLVRGLMGTRLRVMATIGRNADAAAMRADFAELVRQTGASVRSKLVLERLSDDLGLTSADEVSADAEIGTMLEAWALRTPEARERLGELRELAATMESLIPPAVITSAKASGGGASYRLLRLAVENWKSFAAEASEIVLEDCGALVAIEGENASGKSNLMEAEAFALWGRTLRGRQGLAELVRKGESRASVTVEIEAGGERWKVSRTIKIKTGGQGAAELSLARRTFEPGGNLARVLEEVSIVWAPMNLGTAAETQALIDSLVGPLELYLATRYASQGDIDRLLSLTPSEMKGLVQKALNVDLYAERERIGKARLSELEAAAQKMAAKVEALKPGRDRSELEAELENAIAEEILVSNVLEALRGEVERYRTLEADARAAARTASEREAGFERAREAVNKAKAKVDRLAADRSRLEQAVKNGAAARASMEEAEKLEAERAALIAEAPIDTAGASERLRKASEAYSVADREISELKAAHARSVDLIRADAHGASLRLEQSRKAREACERIGRERVEGARGIWGQKIEAAETAAGLISKVPFGEKCAEAGCGFVSAAVAARDGLHALRERASVEIGKLELAATEALAAEDGILEAAQAKAIDAAKALNEIEGGVIPGLLELTVALEAANAELHDARKAFIAATEAELPIKALEAKIRELTGPARKMLADAANLAAAKLEDLTAQEAEATSDLMEALDAFSGMLPVDASALREAADRAQADREAAAREVERKESEHGACMNRRGAREGALVRHDELAAAVAAEEEALRSGRSLVELASLYVRAVSRDGIPYLILERAIPALESHSNHFLGSSEGVDLRIEIESIRDLASGEQRAEVVVRYRNRFGLHSLAAASGFERIALGYAMRAALAQVQSEAQGITLSHWVADEGWGAFDERNMIIGQAMLRRFAERFERVLFVSHVSAIREVADTHLLIVPDADRGSRVEVLS